MLELPTKGIYRSIKEHNVEIDAFCDWIEGGILFGEEEVLSWSNIVDALTEGLIYEDQAFASEMVADAWAELHRRQTWIGGASPYSLEHRRVRRLCVWQEAPAHSFCILLSLTRWYEVWAESFGHDYTEQGELFELLTQESLKQQFPDWQVYQTGWTRSSAVRLAEVVKEVTERLGVVPGELELWAEPSANELGLDLLCYRPFFDNRIGIPIYLMQCASGKHWKKKLKTPDLDVWEDVVRFRVKPKRAFATPFAFSDKEFVKSCVKVQGLLLDRCRLLAAGRYTENWVPNPLRDRILTWAVPRVAALPRSDA